MHTGDLSLGQSIAFKLTHHIIWDHLSQWMLDIYEYDHPNLFLWKMFFPASILLNSEKKKKKLSL